MPLSQTQMQTIVSPYTTVSDKIRALDAAGVPRAQIATFLGKRYQHVRNVLIHPPPKGSPLVQPSAPPAAVEETAAPCVAGTGQTVRLPIAEDGSVRLPPEVLAALGVQPGGLIIGARGEEGLLLLSLPESIRRVQAMVRALTPGRHGTVDEFLADRRREWGEEDD